MIISSIYNFNYLAVIAFFSFYIFFYVKINSTAVLLIINILLIIRILLLLIKRFLLLLNVLLSLKVYSIIILIILIDYFTLLAISSVSATLNSSYIVFFNIA